MSVDLDQLIRGAVEGAAKKHERLRVPQVSLLPTEIRGAGRAQRTRGLLAVGVVAAALLTAAAVTVASGVSADATARSTAATSRLSAASAQLAKFKDVQALQQRIAAGDAAVRVGGATAIDWQRYLGLLTADMPTGFTVTTVQTDAATSAGDYTQGATPLDRPRAATVVLTTATPSIVELPVWLRKLKSVPAYADATPNVSTSESGYTVQVTIHLTTAAYATPLGGK